MKQGPQDCSIKLRVLTFGRKSLIFDLTNAVTFPGGICCLLLAFKWTGQALPQSLGQLIGLCLDCVLCLIFFEFLQWKYREVPTASLRIIRQRSVLNGSCFLFFLGMSSSTVSGFLTRMWRMYTTDWGIVQLLHSTVLPSSSKNIGNRKWCSHHCLCGTTNHTCRYRRVGH